MSAGSSRIGEICPRNGPIPTREVVVPRGRPVTLLGTDLSWPKPAVPQRETGDPPPLSLQSALRAIPSLLDGRNPLFWAMYRTASFHAAVRAALPGPPSQENPSRHPVP
jgi:hypothetical protein